MRFLLIPAVAAFVAVASVVACSDSTPPSASGSAADAAPGGDGGVTEADDAAPGDKDGAPPTPSKTSVDVVIGGVSRTLERAQFGRSKDDAGETLYIEAHEGGDPACPTESTPTPKRTVIVSGVPLGAVGSVYTKADDGIAVSFLDFTGDQLDGKPLSKATAATVTIVAIEGTTSVELDVDATFEEGTAKGRMSAEYCQSLD